MIKMENKYGVGVTVAVQSKKMDSFTIVKSALKTFVAIVMICYYAQLVIF